MMKSLFLKEWRQGRLLLLFGLAFGVLVPILWVLLAVAFVETASDQKSLDEFLAAVYYLVPPVVACVVASGLLAAEVERGTLPVLLALPFSRRRIWTAKVFAGLALTAAALALFSIPGVLLIRDAMGLVALPAYLPDLAIWCVVAFSVALLCSSLAERTIAALLASALICGALFAGTLYLVHGLGGRLVGYDPLFDATLWALAAVPALLVTSLLTFTRGQDLRSRGKWLLAVPALVLMLAVTFAPVVGATRWLTRHVREDTRSVANVSVSPDGSTVSFIAGRSPIRYSRRSDGWHGWQGELRSGHLVLLDLRTGEELMRKRGGGDAAMSPDGRLAVILSHPSPVTWGDRSGPQKIEIRDLKQGRLISTGYPQEFCATGEPGPMPALSEPRWSPDSDWLGIKASLFEREQVLLLRADGEKHNTLSLLQSRFRPPRDVEGSCWDWDPRGAGSYFLDLGGCVVRHSTVEGSTKRVFSPANHPKFPAGMAPVAGALSAAPAGDRLAVALLVLPEEQADWGHQPWRPDNELLQDAQLLVFVVNADGSEIAATHSSGVDRGMDGVVFKWSSEGKTLYFLDPRSGGRRLLRWSEGSPEVTAIRMPVQVRPASYELISGSDTVLVWERGDAWQVDQNGQAVSFVNERVREAARDSRLVGLNGHSRALILKGLDDEPGNFLAAVDLETGEVTRIYP